MPEFKKKLSVEYKDKCLTIFHKQVFDSWQHFYSKPPCTVEDIWHEHLFENKYICSNGTPLKPSEFNVPTDAANNLGIADIVSNNGNIVGIEEFNVKVQKSIDVMSFNRITSAIPVKWKEKLKTRNVDNFVRQTIPHVKVKGKKVEFIKVNNRSLYWAVLNDDLEEPSAIEHWVESYPFLDSKPWYKIFTFTHKIVPETYLQCFQYKILNRLLNCNYNLYKWKITDSNLGFYCNSIDTIEHHLFLCPKTSKFWAEILAWVRSTLNINFEQGYAICEIIFGYHLFETVYTVSNHIHNIVILIGKWYINKTKTEQKTFSLSIFSTF